MRLIELTHASGALSIMQILLPVEPEAEIEKARFADPVTAWRDISDADAAALKASWADQPVNEPALQPLSDGRLVELAEAIRSLAEDVADLKKSGFQTREDVAQTMDRALRAFAKAVEEKSA